MTVMHCLVCDDLIGVGMTRRMCSCGASACRLEEDEVPTVTGPARLLRIDDARRAEGHWVEVAQSDVHREPAMPLL